MLREQSLNLTIATFRVYLFFSSNDERRKIKYEQPINDFRSLAVSLTLIESLVSQVIIQFVFTSTHPSLTINNTNQPNWQVSSWQKKDSFLRWNSKFILFDCSVLHGRVCYFLNRIRKAVYRRVNSSAPFLHLVKLN